jgi:uncharacterized protein YraI
LIITATLPPTLTPRPSETPLPPPPQPTVAPVQGTTSTQVNVRSEPSTAGEVLGIIPANTKVEITGTDPGGNWWQIIYEAGADGIGWVAAQYIETATKPEVPMIGGGETNPDAGKSAIVIQQLNIRSGPGTSFDSLGILNANDVVTLTGRNSNSTWFQVSFESGPNGTGWVNAGFVKMDHADVPASMDNDSADSPIKTVIFDRAGTNTLIYNGNVSAPTGDMEDWIAVTPYDDIVYARIECSGSNLIIAGILGSETNLLCNDAVRSIPVQDGTAFLVHIRAVPSSDRLEYASYILTIKASP